MSETIRAALCHRLANDPSDLELRIEEIELPEPAPGEVQVRLKASTGTLYSKGRVLVTDAQGMTRDRLTTRKTAVITLNAGGTRYRFQVPVTEPSR